MDFTKTRVHPDYIAAGLMIAMVIGELYQNWDYLDYLINNFGYDSLEFFINAILAAVGAVILLVTRHGSIIKTMAVSAMIFALISLDTAILDLVILGPYIDYNTQNFISGAILLALGLIIIANILVYLFKASNNLTIMYYSLGCIIFLDIIQWLVWYRNGNAFWDIVRDVIPDIPKYALIIFIMLLLSSDTVKVKTMMYTVRENSGEIRRSAVPAGVRIGRAEIAELEAIADNGMDCDRYEIPLNSYYSADYKIVLTKNDDRTSLCFSALNDDTGVGMTRFVLKGVCTDTGDAETCDTVRIYGEDMFFIQLIAGDPYVDRAEKTSLKDLVSSFMKKNETVEPEEISKS